MAFAALQGGKMAVGEGIGGIIRSYDGIAQRSRRAAAAGENEPGAGGLRGSWPCVLYPKLNFI